MRLEERIVGAHGRILMNEAVMKEGEEGQEATSRIEAERPTLLGCVKIFAMLPAEPATLRYCSYASDAPATQVMIVTVRRYTPR